MRQHKILSHTLLILSIINFTLAAPTAVRERPEVRLDAKVTRDVKAASQKRRELLDESGSLNVPRPDHAAPPIPDPIDSKHYMAADRPQPPCTHLISWGHQQGGTSRAQDRQQGHDCQWDRFQWPTLRLFHLLRLRLRVGQRTCPRWTMNRRQARTRWIVYCGR